MAEVQNRTHTAPTSQLLTQESQSSETATLVLEGMTCASCALRIEKGLKKVPGVAEASVNLTIERALVRFDPTTATVDDLRHKVEAVGYKAMPLISPATVEWATSSDT